VLEQIPPFVGALTLTELLQRPDKRQFRAAVEKHAEAARSGLPGWPQVNLGPLLNLLLDEVVHRWR